MKKEIWFDKKRRMYACSIEDGELVYASIINWGLTPVEAEQNAMHTRQSLIHEQLRVNFRINMQGQRWEEQEI